MWEAAYALGRLDEVRDVPRQVEALAEGSTDPHIKFEAIRLAAVAAHLRGDTGDAVRLYQRALDNAPPYGGAPVTDVSTRLAQIVQLDDAEEPLLLVQHAVADARRRGMQNQVDITRAWEALCLITLGRFAETRELLAEYTPDVTSALVYDEMALADYLTSWATGLPPQGWDTDPIGDSYRDPPRQLANAAACLANHDAHAAVQSARAALTASRREYGRHGAYEHLPLLSAVACQAGDAELAGELHRYVGDQLLEEQPAMARAFGGWARGRLAPLLGSDGIEDLARAIPELDGYGAPAYAALARLDLAECLGPAHPKATGLRSQAVATLEDLGAFGWIPR